jgi:predicted Fe-Mo cluster-binding NifX family protein
LRVAIPVFENRISPRFDCAPAFLLYDVAGERVAAHREIPSSGWNDMERVSQLTGLGVNTLICGGLPNYLLVKLINNGIKVIPWVAGIASVALDLFLRGKLDSGTVICQGRGKRYHCKKGIKWQQQ